MSIGDLDNLRSITKLNKIFGSEELEAAIKSVDDVWAAASDDDKSALIENAIMSTRSDKSGRDFIAEKFPKSDKSVGIDIIVIIIIVVYF